MLIIRYLLWTLLVLMGLSMVSLNTDPVVFNYYYNTISLPLSLLLLFSFASGWIAGLCFNFINYIKLKTINRRLHQRCHQLETEAMIYSKKQLQSESIEAQSIDSSSSLQEK